MRKNIIIFFEVIVSIILLDIINLIFFQNNLAFIHSKFNPGFLIIIIFASRYGFFSGIFVSLLLTFNMIFLVYQKIPFSLEEINKIFETFNFIEPVWFFVVGVISGAIRQKYIDKENDKNVLLEKLKIINESLEKDLKCELVIKDKLEKKLLESKDFLTLLFDINDKIMKNKKDIEINFLALLKIYFNVSEASFYYLNAQNSKTEFILKANIGNEENKEKSFVLTSEILDILESKNYFLGDKNNSNFLVLYPIFKNEKLIGVLKIEKMPYLYFLKSNILIIFELLKLFEIGLIKQ